MQDLVIEMEEDIGSLTYACPEEEHLEQLSRGNDKMTDGVTS